MKLTNEKQVQALKELGFKWVTSAPFGDIECWVSKPSARVGSCEFWEGNFCEDGTAIFTDLLEIEDISDNWRENILEL